MLLPGSFYYCGFILMYLRYVTLHQSHDSLLHLHQLREDTQLQRERQSHLRDRRQEQATDRLRKIQMRKDGILARDLADARVTIDTSSNLTAGSIVAVPFTDVDGMLDFYSNLTQKNCT